MDTGIKVGMTDRKARRQQEYVMGFMAGQMAYRDGKPEATNSDLHTPDWMRGAACGYREMRQQARDRAYDAGYAAGRAAYAKGLSMPPFAPAGVLQTDWDEGARDGFKPVTVSDPPHSDATRAASLEEH